jgi:hypothetical protein
MRFPQSNTQPISSRVVFIISLIVALASTLSSHARAASQSLIFSPSQLKFGKVTLGQTESQLVVLSNTGQASATISTLSVSGAEFSVSGLSLPVVLAPGQSVALNVIFAPTETGWTGEKVTFTTDSSGNVELPVGGTGTNFDPVVAKPSSLTFGDVSLGSNSTQTVTLTNAVSSKQTLTAFDVAGSGFSVAGPTLPVTLSSGQSITLKVTFTPSVSGVTAGSVFVLGGAVNIPVSGTGTSIGQLTIAPTTVNFGTVLLGTTASEQSTLSATGGSVTISSASSNLSQFAIAGVSFPLTISAGQSVPFNVTFTPQKAGTDSATLSFLSNATDSNAQESVAGTGAAPYVTLSWSPSTSQNISGYNVYRGTAVNEYTKINSSLDPNTSYTDNTVAPGTTYYYACTTVNSSGEESGYSAPIEVVVQ